MPDLLDAAVCQALARWVADRFERVSVLINNAGIRRDIDFTSGADEFLAGQNEVRINLEAPILLSGPMVPLIAGKRPAAISNVSSGTGVGAGGARARLQRHQGGPA